MELIQHPLAIVGDLSIGVIKFAFPMHVVVLPLPIVVASFLVVKLSLPMSLVALLFSLITASILILLDYVISLFI